MQNSQVWNSSHIWKIRLTQGNNATVSGTHMLSDLTTENNLHFIQALFTWGADKELPPSRATVWGLQSGDPRQVTHVVQSKYSVLAVLLVTHPCTGRSPVSLKCLGNYWH